MLFQKKAADGGDTWLIVGLGNPEKKYDGTRQSVGAAAQFFKIPPQRVIVLCDDVDQAAGHMRIRPQGSAGGHNGLKDIIAHLGSQEFIRVRMGVGRKPRPDYDLADWVLGKPAAEDRKAIDARYPDAEAACRLLMAGKLAEAQNKYNH